MTEDLISTSVFTGFLHFLRSNLIDDCPSMIMFGEDVLCTIHHEVQNGHGVTVAVIGKIDLTHHTFDTQMVLLRRVAARIGHDFLSRYHTTLLPVEYNRFREYEEQCLLILYDELSQHVCPITV
jgi:hypothetical protein